MKHSLPSQMESQLMVSNEAEQKAIREQLDRILASQFFSHSKRFPNLLRYVIEQTLKGEGESLKERTLGVEVFGREADYETGTDPIVRVAAAEVRKRLAQYYSEPLHTDELRVLLPAGSYTPKFLWQTISEQSPDFELKTSTTVRDSSAHETEIESVIEPERKADHPEPVPFSAPKHEELHAGVKWQRRLPARHYVVILAVACIASSLLTIEGLGLFQRIRDSALDDFWGPFISSTDPVLVCVADQLQNSGISLRDSSDPSRSRWVNFTWKDNAFATTALDDVNVVVKLGSVLHANQKQFTVKGAGSTNLADLQAGPDIFVGGFDNAWTLRMTNRLRFRFANDPDLRIFRIMDSANPTKPGWVTDLAQVGSSGSYMDYAIVARFSDDVTGRPVLITAGIGRCASLAAGQFLTDPKNLKALEQAAGGKNNMEIVLSNQVIDGQPGSPKIEASYFW
jgi:hypothetical protein